MLAEPSAAITTRKPTLYTACQGRYGRRAAALALGAEGFAKDFIPVSARILAHSKMLDPGKRETLKFTLPNSAGDYQFVCTFPGHGTVMRGIIRAK